MRRSLRTFGNSNLTLSTSVCKSSQRLNKFKSKNIKPKMIQLFSNSKKSTYCPFSMICELHHALCTTSNCSHLSSYIAAIKTTNVQS